MRRLLLLIAVLACAAPVDAAIARVQDCNDVGGDCGAASAASFTITMPANITAGRLVVVLMATNSGTVTVTDVTGCSSQAGTFAVRSASVGASRTAEIWYLQNASGGCATITFNTSGSTSVQPFAVELSGAATASVLDQTGTGADGGGGSTNIALSGALTPTVDNEYFVTVSRHSGTSGTAATNFTEQFDNVVGYVQDWIQTSKTGSTASWTALASTNYATAGASFKEAGAATVNCTLSLLGVGCHEY